MDDLEKRVVDLIAEVLVDANKDSIQLNSNIVNDLGAESLDIYDMIALLEDEFQLEISDEEVEKIQTVQNVVDFIRETSEKIIIGVSEDQCLAAWSSQEWELSHVWVLVWKLTGPIYWLENPV